MPVLVRTRSRLKLSRRRTRTANFSTIVIQSYLLPFKISSRVSRRILNSKDVFVTLKCAVSSVTLIMAPRDMSVTCVSRASI